MGNQVNNIYITADTIISSLGFSTEENIQHIRDYHSGIRQINDKSLYESPFMGGAIDDIRLQNEISAAGLEKYSKIEQLFILSIQEIIKQSGIDITDTNCALILSTTKGNINASLPEMGQRIADHFQLPASPILISSACISGVSALIIASRLIREGKYKHAIVAGGDILTRFVITGFQSFKSVSPNICIPYDKRRDGLSLGEASGAVLVTCDKGFVKEKPAVIIEGGAITNDANHISGPSRTGDGLYAAISSAMAENELQADDISFVNTHGTATVYNDEMESKAVHWVGLNNKPLNSLKSYWGHTLGASGIIESIACVNELRTGELYGTYGFEESDVSYPLQISGSHQIIHMQRCIKTASGFGGCNAAVVLALESYAKPIIINDEKQIVLGHSCVIEKGNILLDNKIVFQGDSEEEFGSFIRASYKELGLDDRKFYKMDDLCKLGYIASACLFSKIDLSSTYKPEEIGIILSNTSASLDTDLKHQHIIETLGDHEASPIIFVYTLPNVVMGEICIRHKIKGENTFFLNKEYDEPFIREYAGIAMRRQNLKACLIGWCELLGESYQARFEWIELAK